MKKIKLISMLALLSLVGSHGSFSTIENRNSSPNQNSTIFLYSSELLVDGYTKNLNENLNENLIIPREINDLILTYYFDSFQYLTDLFQYFNCIKTIPVYLTSPYMLCYHSLCYDAKDKTLFAITRKGTIKRFNDKGECIETFIGHKGGIFYLFYDPKIGILISGNRANGIIKLWNIKEGKCKTLTEDEGYAYRLFYDPKIGILISCNRNGYIRLWNIEKGKCIKTFYTPVDHKANTNYLFYDDKSKILFSTSSNDGDARRIREMFRNTLSRGRIYTREDARRIEGMCRNNNPLNILIGNNGNIKLWNINSLKCIMTLEGDIGEVTALCYDDKSKILFSGESNGNIKLWDIISRKRFKAFKGHDKRVDSLVYIAKTKTLLSFSEKEEIKVWGINLNSAVDGCKCREIDHNN